MLAITVSSMLFALYGIGQRFGVDAFRTGPPAPRVALATGNPVFGAAYLLMTIPLTLALVQIEGQLWTGVRLILVGAAAISLQTTAFAFTVSRGPTLGLLLAALVFVGIVAWVQGRQTAMRPGASLLIAIAIGFALTYVPVPDHPDAHGQLAGRLATIPSEFGGGLGSRYTIWSTAAEAFVSAPWVDTAQFPELPDLALKPLRPIVGFGPDMFGYIYNMVGDSTLQAPPGNGHNFVVHTAIELGLLGVLAYGALVGFATWALVGLVRAARKQELPVWAAYAAIGLSSVLAGRALEQMAGKAQTSDMALSWLLAGVVVAMLRMQSNGWAGSEPARGQGPSTRRRRAGGAVIGARGLLKSDPARLAVAATITLGAIVIWWQAVLAPTYAASLMGAGSTASEIDAAIAASPGSFVPRTTQATNWLNAMQSQTTDPRKLSALSSGLAVLQPAIDRDPLNARAWLQRGVLSRAMATIDPALGPAAIRDWELITAIVPGLWEPHEQFAWTLTVSGESNRALEVVAHTKELGAPADASGYFLWYVEALALIQLGRDAEAEPLIQALAESGSPGVEFLVDYLHGQSIP
ncbi:MAG: O-antigen ligase family protein [Chloroflexi bacterium]|nr:O-antigen ligase family protein [Chloroflexota bacterium]